MNSKEMWKEIPFTEKQYYVTPQGEIISNVYGDYNKLQGKMLKKKNCQLSFDATIAVTGIRVTLQYNRIVFFCYYYPEMLGKKLDKMTFDDYRKMGSIAHKDGDYANVHPSNLLLIPRKNALGKSIAIGFPEKVKKPQLETMRTKIVGDNLQKTIAWIQEGRTYSWIVQQLDVKVHKETICRLRKKIDLLSRSNNMAQNHL